MKTALKKALLLLLAVTLCLGLLDFPGYAWAFSTIEVQVGSTEVAPLYPISNTIKVDWKIDDGNIATIVAVNRSGCLLRGVSAGTTKLRSVIYKSNSNFPYQVDYNIVVYSGSTPPPKPTTTPKPTPKPTATPKPTPKPTATPKPTPIPTPKPTPTPVYVISYDANGGRGAPANQTKTKGLGTYLSWTTPTHDSAAAASYTVTLDPNKGSVSPSSLTAARTTSYSFKNWNTRSNGQGVSYDPGERYTTDAGLSLYAQWDSTVSTAAVNLPTPTRSGYDFKGWAESTSAQSGEFGRYTPSGNKTLHAIWEPSVAASGTLRGLSWTLNTLGELVISGSGSMGSSVPGLEAWREYNYEIKTVTIRSGVTNIAEDAFSSCYNMKSISIPSTVTEIGDFAFSFCKALESVTVPEGVTSISSNAFFHCDSLTKLKLPASYVPDWMDTITNCAGLTSAGPTGSGCSIEYAWTGSIPDYAFNSCNTLTSVTIRPGITKIGNEAFEHCDNLRSVSMPSSLKSIGDKAFQYCGSLTDAALPSGLTSIGEMAFAYCRSLKSAEIPSGVTTLSYRTFNECSGLTHLKIPATVTEIGMGCFDECTGLQSAGPIGSGCDIEFGWTQSIPDNAFAGCGGLISAAIPATVTSIGTSAFNDCSALTDMQIPAGVTSIGNAAFADCSSLTDVRIPAGLKKINWYAFGHCSNLTSVKIPTGVTEIDGNAFCQCESLREVTIPVGVTRIGENAFGGCNSLTELTIPASMTSIEEAAFACYYLTDVYFEGTRAQWNAIAMGEENFWNATIYCIDEPKPDFVVPSGLSVILDEAFEGCPFTCVQVSEEIGYIGSRAFADCPQLRFIYIPAWCLVESDAFEGAGDLTIISISGSEAEDVAEANGYTFHPIDG